MLRKKIIVIESGFAGLTAATFMTNFAFTAVYGGDPPGENLI